MEKKLQEREIKSILEVKPIDKRFINIKVKSTPGSTYISHRLAKETVETFMKRETGKTAKKEFRDFDKEYITCFYYTPDGKYGIPSSAFANAILDSAVALDIKKTQVRRALRIVGDIYEIKYKKLNRRIDNPRRGGINKTPDTRHRPEFVDWECTIQIGFDNNLISPEQIINLVNQAGFSTGVGDWRPSSPRNPGTHGMFEVVAK